MVIKKANKTVNIKKPEHRNTAAKKLKKEIAVPEVKTVAECVKYSQDTQLKEVQNLEELDLKNSTVDDDKQVLEKYKELYSSSKESLNDENKRFSGLEEKAVKYLSALTALLGLILYFLNWSLEDLVPPQNKIESFMIFLIFITLLLSVICINYLFKIFKVCQKTVFPMNKETIAFFVKNKTIDIYYAFALGNSDAIAKNREAGDKKAHFLYLAYNLMYAIFWLLLIFSFVFMYYKCDLKITQKNEKKAKFMCKENELTTSTPDKIKSNEAKNLEVPKVENRNQPNLNIKYPNYEVVNESYNPKPSQDIKAEEKK